MPSHSLPTAHATIGTLLAALALTAHADARPAAPQESGESFFEMSIEDLLSIRVPSMTNVLGGHVHNQGEWMPMLHVMRMEMDGMRDGTDDLSTGEVVAPPSPFLVTPVEMTMDMAMAGLMYAPTDVWTVMVMVPLLQNSMRHRTRAGGEFTTRSEGVGDVELSALAVVWESESSDLILGAGVSLPTGSIDEKDQTPMGRTRLPYPMQLGSGTYDLVPGATYLSEHGTWAWGAQAKAVIRLGENDNDYRLGNRIQGTAWVDRKWTDALSTSVRAVGHSVGNIVGSDPAVTPPAGTPIVPTADPDRQGKDRIDLALGFQYYNERTAGHRIALEVGTPVVENLDGPQLSTEWWLAFSYSITFF